MLCREARYDADMEEALISSKLDAIGAEYSARIQNQLDEQRQWFDSRHAKTVADCESRLASVEQALIAAKTDAANCQATAHVSERQRKILDAKLVGCTLQLSRAFCRVCMRALVHLYNVVHIQLL